MYLGGGGGLPPPQIGPTEGRTPTLPQNSAEGRKKNSVFGQNPREGRRVGKIPKEGRRVGKIPREGRRGRVGESEKFPRRVGESEKFQGRVGESEKFIKQSTKKYFPIETFLKAMNPSVRSPGEFEYDNQNCLRYQKTPVYRKIHSEVYFSIATLHKQVHNKKVSN